MGSKHLTSTSLPSVIWPKSLSTQNIRFPAQQIPSQRRTAIWWMKSVVSYKLLRSGSHLIFFPSPFCSHFFTTILLKNSSVHVHHLSLTSPPTHLHLSTWHSRPLFLYTTAGVLITGTHCTSTFQAALSSAGCKPQLLLRTHRDVTCPEAQDSLCNKQLHSSGLRLSLIHISEPTRPP